MPPAKKPNPMDSKTSSKPPRLFLTVLKKALSQQLRSPLSLFMNLIFIPVFFSWMYFLLNKLAFSSLDTFMDASSTVTNSKAHPMPGIHSCVTAHKYSSEDDIIDCKNLIWSPSDCSECQQIIDFIQTQQGWADSSIKSYSTSAEASKAAGTAIQSPAALLNFDVLPADTNTPVGVKFGYDSSAFKCQMIGMTVRCLNATENFVAPYLNSLAQALVKIRKGKDLTINAEYRNLPHPPAENSLSLDSFIFPMWAVLIFGSVLITFIQEAVTSKVKHQRLLLQSMGVSNVQYWGSWLVSWVLRSTIVAIISYVLTLTVFKVDAFSRTTNIYPLISYISMGCSITALGYLFSSFINSNRAGGIAGFLIIFLSMILTQLGTSLIFTTNMDTFVQIIALFLSPLAFAQSISYLFTADAYGRTVTSWALTHDTDVNPITWRIAVLYIWVDTLIYLVVAAYLDVTRSVDGMAPKRRWNLKPYVAKRTNVQKAQEDAPILPQEILDETVSPLEERCARLARGRHAGIVMSNVWKTYRIDVEKEKRKHAVNAATSTDESASDSDSTERQKVGTFARILGGIKRKFTPSVLSDFHAAAGVSLNVPPGEIMGLLGVSGSGKSTTMSLLLGLQAPSAGHLSINGVDSSINSEVVRKMVGFCSQNDIFWAYLNAEEHLMLCASIRGVPKEKLESEAKKHLHTVGLYDVRHRNPLGFSGGMKRRLSVAMAVIGDPAVLLFDEPTAGVDVHASLQIFQAIATYSKREDGSLRPIIVTSHKLDDLERACSSVALLAAGRVMSAGTVPQLKDIRTPGYNVVLVAEEEERTADLAEHIATRLGDLVSSVKTSTDTVTIGVTAWSDDIYETLKYMEDEENKRAIGLKSFSFACPTLEDVFLTVANVVDRREDGLPIPIEKADECDVEIEDAE